MSTGCSWEGIRQVRATLLSARHVPERFCGGYVYLERYIKCSTFTFTSQPPYTRGPKLVKQSYVAVKVVGGGVRRPDLPSIRTLVCC